MTNTYLFTADVDSTLRGHNGPMPGEKTLAALEEMHQRGWLIGIESGRPLWQEMEDHHRQWNLSFQFDFIIGMNGGELHDYSDNTVETFNPLSCEDLKRIVEGVLPFGVNPFIYRQGYMFSLRRDHELEASSLRHSSRFEICQDVCEIWSQPTAKLLVRTDHMENREEFIAYCQKHLTSDRVTCFMTTPVMLEFQSPHNSKATALDLFCQRHGISRDHIYAFGDSENDIPMLEYAGHGIAVGNAMDVVKQMADDITYGVDEDGVGRYLFEHVL
ncbi:MAG: HAD family hydrolase [Bulleidia sp.]